MGDRIGAEYAPAQGILSDVFFRVSITTPSRCHLDSIDVQQGDIRATTLYFDFTYIQYLAYRST